MNCWKKEASEHIIYHDMCQNACQHKAMPHHVVQNGQNLGITRRKVMLKHHQKQLVGGLNNLGFCMFLPYLERRCLWTISAVIIEFWYSRFWIDPYP